MKIRLFLSTSSLAKSPLVIKPPVSPLWLRNMWTTPYDPYETSCSYYLRCPMTLNDWTRTNISLLNMLYNFFMVRMHNLVLRIYFSDVSVNIVSIFYLSLLYNLVPAFCCCFQSHRIRHSTVFLHWLQPLINLWQMSIFHHDGPQNKVDTMSSWQAVICCKCR